MPQTEQVPDLVHRRIKPTVTRADISSTKGVLPVFRIVHDGDTATGQANHATRSGVDFRIESPHITGHHRQTTIDRLDEIDPQVFAVELKDLAAALLLVIGNRVEQNITLWIKSVFVLEVVEQGRNAINGIRGNERFGRKEIFGP